jgi:hypothetical protein
MHTGKKWLATAVVVMLAACDASVGPGAPSEGARMAIVLQEIGVPFSRFVSRCTGGPFLLAEGKSSVTITSDSVMRGFNQTFSSHYTAKGVATDPETGTRYQLTENQQLHIKLRPDTTALTLTSQVHSTLIAEGPEPNLQIASLFHLTVRSDGSVSALVDESREICTP